MPSPVFSSRHWPVLTGILGLLALIGATQPAAASAAPDSPKAVTDPAQVDADFAFQGEYAATFRTARGLVGYGLQVVALGDGQFDGYVLRGGLPGAGWNGGERTKLSGKLAGDRLTLTGEGIEAIVEPSQAKIDAIDGWIVELSKVQRSSPTLGLAPPANAIKLFDGTDTGELNGVKISEDGLLEVGAITKRPVGDFRLHIEFRTPYMPRAKGQGRGNSGVYIQQRYEVQILDSFGLPGEFNECGSLYRQTPPDLNMCLPPLTWQSYDIEFIAARFDAEGKVKIAPARLTVYHNGVPVHYQREIASKTGAGQPEGPTPRPILFQNHSDPVRFRNMWLVDLTPATTESIAASCEPTHRRCGIRRLFRRCR